LKNRFNGFSALHAYALQDSQAGEPGLDYGKGMPDTPACLCMGGQ